MGWAQHGAWATGSLNLRLELREYSVLSGPSMFLEDSAELEGTLQ